MGEEYKRKKKMPPNYKKSFLLTNTFTKQKAKEQLYGMSVFLLGYLFFPQGKTNMLKKKVTICIYLEFPYIKKGNKKILRGWLSF